MFSKACLSTALLGALASCQLADAPKRRSMCKMAGDTSYWATRAYGLRPKLTHTFGHFLFEQDEGSDLKILYGKMWNLKKSDNGEFPKLGLKMMQYPHTHGSCEDFGHWNPPADAWRAKNGGT